MQKYEDNLASRLNGNALQPLALIQVRVTDDATGLPASLYADDGVTPLPQPLITDNNGGFGFRAPNGKYTLTFSGATIATFTRKVILDDPSENKKATLAELASPTGATLIGHSLGPVSDLLSKSVTTALVAQVARNNTVLRSGERPTIFAHRGFDSTYPQNSMLAFSSAIQAGADGLEVDVSFSSDGVAYCFHDTTVDALTTGTGSFTSLTSATIDTLRFDALAGTIFADEPICKFADVLKFCRSAGVPIHAEIKQTSGSGQFATAVEQIRAADMLGLASLQSGTLSNVTTFRSLNADINVGYITTDPAYQTYVDHLAGLGNATVVMGHDTVFANPGVVAYCAAKGVDLIVYTIPDTFYLNRVARLGVTKFMCSRFARGNK